jgi:hypothetical protein
MTMVDSVVICCKTTDEAECSWEEVDHSLLDFAVTRLRLGF